VLTQAIGEALCLVRERAGAQEWEVRVVGGQTRQALCYPTLTGAVRPGDQVLLNTTAQTLALGTGGYDFVRANLTTTGAKNGEQDGESLGAAYQRNDGHIIKARYLPCQHAVLTLEEQKEHASVWERTLENFPVLVGQLHSQIAPAAAALSLSGKKSVAYVMTDGAALIAGFSRLVGQLKEANLLHAVFTCGQASGGDYETVTLHSALLAAKHIARCDAAIVCQGPGNAGTGTRYGFSGMEQAQNLDIVRALGGKPIAVVRMSEADPRARHQGVSHHTCTSLDMAYARCIVPVPLGADIRKLPPGHDIREIGGTQAALDLLTARQIKVSTMGRTPEQDPLFFHAAAAAGLVTE